jgi:hypothetical protein
MVIHTPHQKLCRNTDIVTGWMNAFHFWDPSGNILSSFPNSTLLIDKIPYPQRKLTSLPTAIGDIRSCTSGDTPWASFDHNNAGMLAKIIKPGIPDGYEETMKKVGFFLPNHIRKEDHSILSPEPIWLTHFQQSGDVSYFLLFFPFF